MNLTAIIVRRSGVIGGAGPSETRTFGSRVIYERYRRARDESDWRGLP